MLVLVTGTAGKVGAQFLHRLLTGYGLASVQARVTCHNRMINLKKPSESAWQYQRPRNEPRRVR